MACAESLRPALVALVVLALAAGTACTGGKRKRQKTVSRPPAQQTQPVAENTSNFGTSQGTSPTRRAAAPGMAPPPDNATPQQRYAYAIELLKRSRWTDAERELVAFVRKYPQFTGPHTNLGIVYARTNRQDLARKAFGQAVRADSKNAIAHNWIGVLARQAGDHATAERAYRAALTADERHADALLNLAILYDQHLKRPQHALVIYRRYHAVAGDTDPRAAVWVEELKQRSAATAGGKT